MANVIPVLYPLNDLALSVKLEEISPTTGAKTLVTTGAVTAFLATSNGPTAAVADATLNATVNYSGAGGKWIVTIDAAILTAALLNTLFVATIPYLIVVRANGVRVYVELAYLAARPATVTA